MGEETLMQPISRADARALGLQRYFTGRACVRGGIAQRAVSDCSCACDACTAVYRSESSARYHAKRSDPEFVAANRKRASEWGRRNPEIVARRVAEFAERNPDRYKEISRKAWTAHRERSKRLPAYRMAKLCRSLVERCLSLTGTVKSKRTEALLGYGKAALMRRLESQFEHPMSWENYGDYWHVDHIASVSELFALGVTDPAIVNKLSNLRPLPKFDNLSKGDGFELGVQFLAEGVSDTWASESSSKD